MEEVKVSTTSPTIEPVGGFGEQIKPPKLKHDHEFNLIPRPSGDPRDPLNWPMSKKVGIVAVLCLAVFSGYLAPLTGQLNIKPQSILYKQSTTHIAWQNSAASAGLATGGFFFAPVSFQLGRSSVILLRQQVVGIVFLEKAD